MVVVGGQGYTPIRKDFYIVPDSVCNYNQKKNVYRIYPFGWVDEFKVENRKSSQSWRARDTGKAMDQY